MKTSLIIALVVITIVNTVNGQWVRKPDLPIAVTENQISIPSNNCIWIGFNDLFIYRTTNGGENWNNISALGISVPNIISLEATNENTVMISYMEKVYRTSNSGQNWNIVFNQSGGYVNSIEMINSTTGYLMGDPVGGRWSLWKTTDAGATWDSSGMYLRQISNEFTIYGRTFCDQDIGWIFTSNRRGIYKSSNFRDFTYYPTPGVTPNQVIPICFLNQNTGYVGRSSSNYKTTNGGINWVLNNTYIPNETDNNYSWGCNFPNPNIWYSNDFGNTYNSFSYPHTIYVIPIMKSKTAENQIKNIYAFNLTELYVNQHTVGIEYISEEIPDKYNLYQNYPNPFNPSTKIIFDLKEYGKVKLKVFDMLGKEVSVLVNESLSPGRYEATFDGAGLPSGVYLYKLESSRFSDVRKMMLIK